MDAQSFLTELGHVAAASNGAQQLRKMIVLLGVSGKLIAPQSRTTANELLDALLTRRKSLEGNGLFKRQGHRTETGPNDLFVQTPDHWARARINDIGQVVGGGTPRSEVSSNFSEDDGIAWYTPADLYGNREKFVVRSRRRLTKQGLESSSAQLLPAGTVLFSSRAPIGYVAILGSEAATNQGFKSVVPALDAMSEFIHLYLRAVAQFVESRASGTTFKEVSGSIVGDLPISFPGLEEQALIVAKVDELLALCDRMEVQQQRGRNLQKQLRQATVRAVAGTGSAHELQATWPRFADNFSHLFQTPEDEGDLRGLILDLAVSGRLLSSKVRVQTTAAELLESIGIARLAWASAASDQERREALSMLKKLRTQLLTVPDAKLPEHWRWASLLQVSQAVVDCHNKTATYVGNGIHLVRTSDIRNGRMDLTNTKKISEESYAHWARRMSPRPGDIIFTREAPMGEAAIVPDGEKICLGQRTMLIRLLPELFSNQFLLYVIQSPSFQHRMVESAVGMTVKHLRVGGVEDLVVPVPPRAEQDRIVELVDYLFRYCELHSEQLRNKQSLGGHLAISFVEVITGVSTERQEREAMRAPQTELIAPLVLGQAPGVRNAAPLATILAHHDGQMSAKDVWQRFGGEIDAFYAQLKHEVALGWIREPAVAEMRQETA